MPEKLSDARIAEIRKRVAQGENDSQIAREMGVYRKTVAKYRPAEVDGTKRCRTVAINDVATEKDLRDQFNLGDEWVADTLRLRLHNDKAHTHATFKRAFGPAVEKAIRMFASDNVQPIPKKKLPTARRRPRGPKQCLAWGLWDTHFGALAHSDEVGESWDIKIAQRRIFNSIDDMMLELVPYNITRIWMPIGNDFLHFDSNRLQTAKGDHALDWDSRFSKVYLLGFECLAYMVERALELGAELELLHVPGNHDTTSSFTLMVALAQRFLNDKRVTCDLRPIPRKYRMFGGSLVGFSHGEKAPAKKLNTIFSTETRKKGFAQSTYREMQVGHKHQRNDFSFEGAIPTNGLIVRTNPCLCNIDKYHFDHGFISEPIKSVEAWRYDEVGYRGSHVAWARDDYNPRIGTVQMK